MKSILQRARDEGYRNGAGQASQVNHDEAYWEGQQSAYAEAPSRFAWFMLGASAGTISIWIWILT